MAKKWDYADLSKLASAHGGPQELLKKLAELYMKKGFSEGFKKGADSKKPVIAAVGAACFALGSGSVWAYVKYKKKKALTTAFEAADNAEIEKVEEELIAGMKSAREANSEETAEAHKLDVPQKDNDTKE